MSKILNTSGEFYFTIFGEYSLTTYIILILLAMISLMALNTILSLPVFDNLSRKYHIVFRSGNFSGYPKKFMKDMRSLPVVDNLSLNSHIVLASGSLSCQRNS